MMNCFVDNLDNGARVIIEGRDADKNLFREFATLKVGEMRHLAVVETDAGLIFQKDGNRTFTTSGIDPHLVYTVWTGPFPNLPENDILQMYEKLDRLGNADGSVLLFYFKGYENGKAAGHIVQTDVTSNKQAYSTLLDEQISLKHLVFSKDLVFISEETLPSAAKIGDLVGASKFSCTAEVNQDGRLDYLTHLQDAAVLADCPSPIELTDLIPDGKFGPEPTFGYRDSFTITSIEDHFHQQMAAKAKTERDLGVFLSVPDDRGGVHLVHVKSQGIQLFGHDHVEDHLENQCPPQGIWAFENAKYFAGPVSCGMDVTEWDEGLDGKFVPVTGEHLNVLDLTLEELGDAIIESMRDCGHSIGDNAIECALAWLQLAPAVAATSDIEEDAYSPR